MYGNGGFGWFWLIWIGIVFVVFCSFGNWGYSYSVHRRLGLAPKGALDIPDERYARGEIVREEYGRMTSEIMRAPAPRAGLLRRVTAWISNRPA
jgi:uncharacterized membrane protein